MRVVLLMAAVFSVLASASGAEAPSRKTFVNGEV